MRRAQLQETRPGRWTAAATSAAVLAVTAITVFAGQAAGQETPEQRCRRETAAYNSAWESTWRASNPGNPGPPPAPPVPYVCVDPGTQPSTTTTPPPTAPGLMPTQAPGGGVQGQAGNAPGRLPQGNGTDIVPGPEIAAPSTNAAVAPIEPSPEPTPPSVPDTSELPQPSPSGTTIPAARPVPVRPVREEKAIEPDAPPDGEGPGANGCASCERDSATGYILPGDVGPVPSAGDRWTGSDRYVNHWVIDTVDNKGQVIPPGDRPLLGQCIPKEGVNGYVGGSGFDVAWSNQSVNMTQNSWTVGGKGSAGGEAGPVELGGEINGSYTRSTSTSESRQLTTTGRVNCGDYPAPPAGQVLKFYQAYQQLNWTGRWELYSCSIFGCKKVKEQPLRGVYYAPLPTPLGRPESL
ncbi:hypothetical protein [Nocardia yamanashiensis]|uniref:hypothetical protein n=1 Tax=Nocardia yamanashiensis TaxID=209247 RepID=UPI000ABA7FC9|nr:hypothetical protein [Nocardia yamanashiensis]